MKWKSSYKKRYQGVGENFEVKRGYAYCETCQSGFYVVDEAINLPRGSMYLKGVQEIIVMAGLHDSFEEAAKLLGKARVCNISSQQIHRITSQAGEEVILWEEEIVEEDVEEETNPFKKEEKVEYLEMDGIIILDRKGEGREIKVGCTFAGDKCLQLSPKRRGILKTEYVAHLGSCIEFADKLKVLPFKKAEEQAILGDGSPWIWNIAEEKYCSAEKIVDFYHMSEYVWEAARAVYGIGTKEAIEWSESQLTLLKESNHSAFEESLGKMLKEVPDKEPVKALYTYYMNHRDKMDYKRYLEKGYFIGSGAAESAVKRVCAKRMKQSGMLWSDQGAQKVVKLRAMLLSDGKRWECFWQQKAA